MGIAPYDRHRKVMLRRVTIKAHSVGGLVSYDSSIKAHSVGVDILRRSSIKAHSVGVDAHIDPKVRRSLSEFIFVRGLLLRGSEVSTR